MEDLSSRYMNMTRKVLPIRTNVGELLVSQDWLDKIKFVCDQASQSSCHAKRTWLI